MSKPTIKSDFLYSSSMIIAAMVSGIAQVAAIWYFVGINEQSDAFFTALVAFQTINSLATIARGPMVGRLTPLSDVAMWFREGTRITVASMTVVLVVSLVLLAIAQIISLATTDQSLNDVLTKPLVTHLYLVLVAAVLITGASCMTGILISRFQFRLSALIYLASAAVTTIVTFPLCAWLGVYGASLSILLSSTVLFVAHIWALRRLRSSAARLSVPARSGEPAEPQRGLGWFGYETVSLFAVSGSWQISVLIVSAWAAQRLEGGSVSVFNIGASAVGIATAATAGALTYVLLPHAVAAVARGDYRERATIAIDAMKHPLLVLAPLPVCLALLASQLADAFEFAATRDLTYTFILMLVVLLAGAVIQSIATSLALVALSDKRWNTFLVTGAVTVATLVLLLILVAPGSIAGVALEYVAAVLAGTVIFFTLIMRRDARRVFTVVGTRLAVLVVLAAIAGVAARLMVEVSGESQASVVAAVVLAGFLYLGLAYLAFPEYRGLLRGEGIRTVTRSSD